MTSNTTEEVTHCATFGRSSVRPRVCIADEKRPRGLPANIVFRKLCERLGVIPAMISIAFCVISYDAASAEPVLFSSRSHEIDRADGACGAQYQFLLKLGCHEDKLCRRAINVIADCKADPTSEARAFYGKLLNHFAADPQCQITTIHLSSRVDPSDGETAKHAYEPYEWATWQLILRFTPGVAKQRWSLWPGPELSGLLEGEGDAPEIVRDVCTMITRAGAKIRTDAPTPPDVATHAPRPR